MSQAGVIPPWILEFSANELKEYEASIKLAEELQLEEALRASSEIGLYGKEEPREMDQMELKKEINNAKEGDRGYFPLQLQSQMYLEEAIFQSSMDLCQSMRKRDLDLQTQVEMDRKFALSLYKEERGNHMTDEELDGSDASDFDIDLDRIEDAVGSAEMHSKRMKLNEANINRISREMPKIPVRTISCGICMDEVVENDVIHPRNCSHPFCNECIVSYVLKSKEGTLPCKCPQDNCAGQVTMELLKNHLTHEEVNKLEAKEIERQVLERGGMYCPNGQCSILLSWNPQGRLGLARCPGCQYPICTNCKSPWHNGFTCHQYQSLPVDERNEGDMSLKMLADQHRWRRCIGCKVLIELSEGCFHMTCKCSAEFCYLCGSEWNKATNRCGAPEPCPLWDENRIINNQQPVNVRRNINLEGLFRTRSNMNTELRYCVKRRMCLYCRDQFGSLAELDHHLNTTNDHVVLACCGKIFINRTALADHSRTVHG